MKLAFILIYGFLFAVSFFILAVLWHWQMSEVYFVCRSKGVISDFVPPFVPAGATDAFFIKPPHVVYTIWCVYVGVLLVVPATSTWLVMRWHQQELKKAWM
jgi:hypothetical protein